MSINWVMLSPSSQPPFTALPSEKVLYTSPPRIALSIRTPTHYPGKQQQPLSITSGSGLVYLTSRRIIYLPAQSTDKLQSFATPYLNLHDSHVTAPFFGPNAWQALLQPVSGGGIPAPSSGVVELTLTFKDGGAFDFHSKFVQLKERAQQAAEAASMSGTGQTVSAAAAAARVDLEDLPVYQERSDGPLIAPIVQPFEAADSSSRPNEALNPPSEPPPGYDEAQIAGLHQRRSHRS